MEKLNIDINDITTGQCISIFGTEEMSIFEHVIFDNLRNCETQVFDTEGSFNVYESKIKMNHVEFKNNKLGDDGINIIKSDFDLENIKLTNIHSDGLDLDYSQGTIKNFSCIKCLNDGIDISNTTLILEKLYASNISDKALSVGELSTLFAKKIYLNNSKIGLAVKDGSSVVVEEIKIEKTKYPITTYVKKQEFGPASLEINKLDLISNTNKILLEEGTKIKLTIIQLKKLLLRTFTKIYIQMQNTKTLFERKKT